MPLLQKNQPLFALIALLLAVILMLSTLNYLIARYGPWLFNRIIRFWLWMRQYLEQNNIVRQFKESYPTLYTILSQRFDVRHFYGLSLTLLGVLMVYILALYIGLVEDVVTLNPIVAVDYFVSAQMSLLRDSDIINFFIIITSFASTPMTVLVILCTAIFCWLIQQRHIFIGLLIATVGSSAFTFLSKSLILRARPADILLFERTYSFPSGHATITIALYGFIAYLLIRFNQSFIQQVRIFVIAIFFMILIGLSRIVLNEHYFSDVLAGYLVGGLWLTIAISVSEWLSAKHKITWRIEWSLSHIYLLWLSVIGILISTLLYAQLYQFPLLS